jgi:PAS domain S-box-containing protein
VHPLDVALLSGSTPASGGEPRTELLLRAPTLEVVRLLGADGALVFLLNEDGTELRFAAEASEVRLAHEHWLHRIRLRVGQGLIGKAVADREIAVTSGYIGDTHFAHTEPTDAFARETGLQSFVVAPLLAGDEVFGALGVFDHRPDAFGPQQVALVRALADHAALAIANARLIVELDRARVLTKRQADLERALRELGTRISAEGDIRSVVGSVVKEATRLTGGDGGRVDILDPEGRALLGVYATDRETELGGKWPDDPDDSVQVGVSGRAVLTQMPVMSPDYLEDASFVHGPGPDAFARSAGIRAVLAVPLFGDEGPIGALTVWSLTPAAFDEDDVDVLQVIAGQAAVALIRARLIDELGRSREALGRRAAEERALRDLARRSMTSLDPADVLDDVVAEAARLLGPGGAMIGLLRPAPRSGDRQRSAGISDADLAAWRTAAGDNAARTAVEERRTVVGEGLGAIKSYAIAPVMGEGNVFGALAVLSPLPDAYGPEQTSLLGSLADHAALALVGADLVGRLEESEERYRSLVDSLPDLVFTCDVDGAFTFMSESVERVLGWAPPEVVGRHFRDFVVGPDGGPATGRRFQALADNPGRALVTRFELRTKSGDTKAVEVAAAAFIRDGTFAGVHGSARDISDQERLERELRSTEARYRYLVESSPDLVWMTDAAGRLTFVSDRALPVIGWSPPDLIGRSFADLAPPADRKAGIARFMWLRRHPTEPHRARLRVVRADGTERLVEVTAIGMLADGVFVGAHGAARDIGELDRLEADLRRQAAELAASEERAHLARELHDSVTQALFSMTLQSRSIELLLARDPAQVPGKLAELRELQRDALAEMRALIFELRPANLEDQGLAGAMRTHAAGLSGRIGLPIAVDADLGDQRPSPETEDALYRIAQEALHNIVRHAGARQARVEISRHADGIRVRIEDDGHGFDPLTVAAGHLGLAGMRTRAERLGGRLTVTSEPGKGTVVDAVIPSAATRVVAQSAGTVNIAGVRRR